MRFALGWHAVSGIRPHSANEARESSTSSWGASRGMYVRNPECRRCRPIGRIRSSWNWFSSRAASADAAWLAPFASSNSALPFEQVTGRLFVLDVSADSVCQTHPRRRQTAPNPTRSEVGGSRLRGMSSPSETRSLAVLVCSSSLPDRQATGRTSPTRLPRPLSENRTAGPWVGILLGLVSRLLTSTPPNVGLPDKERGFKLNEG